ncbi:hypothetical protein CYY_003307 [Polysphondylium violaceum]|uniref:IPT/TIG domain-containing protein n=1 Tax=Polysphondylium violaceum TaxID=133409 RepID=A0A8J4PWL6_9MYCE|nr:hypothetical protein CYY_003307 [Polysphondylium violaceum]
MNKGIIVFLFLTLVFKTNWCIDPPVQNGTQFSFSKNSQVVTELRYLNETGYKLLPINDCSNDPSTTVCTFELRIIAKVLLVQDNFLVYSGGSYIDDWSVGLNNNYIDPVSDISTLTQNYSITVFFSQIGLMTESYVYIIQNGISTYISLKNENPNEFTQYILPNFPAGSGVGTIRLSNFYERQFNHSQPEIDSLSSTLTTTTITGRNFFTWINQTSIWINNIALPQSSIVSVGQNQIALKVPKNSVGSFDYKVSISGIQSQIKTLNLYPIVKSITTTLKTGGLVTITGDLLFTKRPNGDPTSISIQIGDTATITSATNLQTGDINHLVFTIPPGDKDYQKVTVTIDGFSSQETSVDFSYEVPEISSITQSGTKLIISGTSLLSKSIVVVNNVTLGNLTYIDSSSASIELPPTTKDGSLYVRTEEKISNNFPFTLKPFLSSLSGGSTSGSIITIYGSFLKLQSTNTLVSTDKLLSCINFVQGDGSYITCSLSKGVGKNHSMTLTIGSTQMSGTFSFNPPVINTFSQSFDEFTLSGNNFGLYNNATTIYFGGSSYKPTFESFDTLKFKIPASSKPGPVYVVVAAQTSLEKPLAIGPAIQSVLFPDGGNEIPTNSDIDSFGNKLPYYTKKNITIQGLFFYPSQSYQVTLKNDKRIITCENATVVDDQATAIKCTPPWSSGIGYIVHVTTGNFFATLDTPFNYEKPTIFNSSTVSDTGGIVTIFGSGFAPQSGVMSVNIDKYKCIDPYGTSSQTLECFIPKFDNNTDVPRNNLTIYLNVNGQSTFLENSFAFNVTALPVMDSENAPTAKWLVAAILVPCLAAILAIVVVSIIFVNRYKKLKMIKKELRP